MGWSAKVDLSGAGLNTTVQKKSSLLFSTLGSSFVKPNQGAPLDNSIYSDRETHESVEIWALSCDLSNENWKQCDLSIDAPGRE